jgi:hypothetical protein
MRKITQLLSALVFCSLIIFASCGGGGTDPEPEDVRIAAGNNLVTVAAGKGKAKMDNLDRTEWDDASFTFTFNSTTFAGTYTVTGIPTNDGATDVWKASGTWKFTGTTIGAITLDGTKPAELTISETSATLKFDVAGAREASFVGGWAFTWTK